MINNKRSIESVLASGAVHEGNVRDYYCKAGKYLDGWQYSLLANDYFEEKFNESAQHSISEAELIRLMQSLLPAEEITLNSTIKYSQLGFFNSHGYYNRNRETFLVDLTPINFRSYISGVFTGFT